MRSGGFLPSRDVAQPGRALAWGARGRQFKSARPDHFFEVNSCNGSSNSSGILTPRLGGVRATQIRAVHQGTAVPPQRLHESAEIDDEVESSPDDTQETRPRKISCPKQTGPVAGEVT